MTTKIENTKLSNQSKNQLIKNKIVNTDQLRKIDNKELYKIRGLGQKSLEEIIDLKNQLEYKCENTDWLNIQSGNYIEEVLNKKIENIITDKNLLNKLKLNNIQLFNSFIDHTPEDIKKLRGFDKKQQKQLWKCIMYAKEKIGLKNISIFEEAMQNPDLCFKEIITDKLPKTKEKVKTRFYFDDEYSEYLNHKIFNNAFTRKEMNFIEKTGINSIVNLLDKSMENLYKVRGISNKSISKIIEKLCLYIITYSNKKIYFGNVTTIFLTDQNLGFLLDNDEELTHSFITKLSEKISDVINVNDYSLEYTIDFLKDNESLSSLWIEEDMQKILVYALVQNQNGKLTQDEAVEYFGFFENINVIKSLSALKKSGYIEKINGVLLCKKPSVLSNVKKNYSENIYLAFAMRVEGLTLEAIGQKLGVTRERIRQINARVLNNLSEEYREDKYAYWYNNYNLKKEAYEKIFDDNNYDYLTLRYKQGNKDISEIIEDDYASIDLKTSVRQYINRDNLVLSNKIIQKNRNSILEFLMEEYVDKIAHIDDILEIYNIFIEEQKLDVEKFIIDIRTLENVIGNSDFAVTRGKKQYRYYNFNFYDWNEFYNRLNIYEWDGKEITTRILFNSHNALMKEYNIHHENELHNVIKKTHNKHLRTRIKVTRMPGISVGSTDRKEQVISFMIDNAPINVEDFVEKYSETFGTKKSTIKANYLPLIKEYIYKDVIDLESNNVSNNELEIVKKVIGNRKFLFYDDLKKELHGHISNEKLGLALNKLKFKRYITYLLSSDYQSTRGYFDEIYIDNQEIIDFTNIDKRIWNLSSFNSWLYDKVLKLELVEFQYKKFITIQHLRNIGITKQELLEYRKKALEKLQDGHIWTVSTLIDVLGANHLDDFGFDLIFYRSIIRGADKVYSTKVTNNYLLKLESVPTVLGIIEDEISRCKSLDVFELTQKVNEIYELDITKTFVVTIVNESSMYYDPIMEKVYLDLNYYYEELE